MIAILYEANEVEFTSNGLGGLPDAYEDDVHWKFNGEYELSFKYKVSGHNYDRITEDRIIFVSPSPNKDRQPFRIRRVVTNTDKNSITVYARHLAYDLSYVPLKPFTASSANEAISGLKSNSLIAHNFTFWTDLTNAGTFTVSEPTSVRNWLGGRAGSILDVFGGEYEWDRWTVKLLKAIGSDKGVTIRYGKNLKSLEQDRNIDSVYTGTVAYWIDSNTKKIVMSDIQYISNHADYPHEKIFPYNATQDFKDEPTVAQLNTRASTYNTANDIGKPTVSVKIDFESLANTDEYKNILPLETVSAGDTIHVIYERFNVSNSGKVNEYNYSWTKEKYKDISIGDLKSSFNEAVSKTVQQNVIPQTASFLEEDRKRATALLTGAYGGHMVIGLNADGEPEETYWMDTGDTATATKVLRANYNGIGGSVNGINGPYGVSMTLDGHINADYVTTGTLRAINITGCDFNNNNGTFHVDSSGNLTANSATIKGTIYADSGTIAGWSINKTQIFSSSESYDTYIQLDSENSRIVSATNWASSVVTNGSVIISGYSITFNKKNSDGTNTIQAKISTAERGGANIRQKNGYNGNMGTVMTSLEQIDTSNQHAYTVGWDSSASHLNFYVDDKLVCYVAGNV